MGLVNNQFLLHTALNETFSKLSCKILFRFPFLKNRFGQYFLKNLLCAIKTGFSGATRGGANQVPPLPSQHISPPSRLSSLHSSMIMIVDHVFYQILSIKKKIPKFFFGASCIITTTISSYLLVFDLKKVSCS